MTQPTRESTDSLRPATDEELIQRFESWYRANIPDARGMSVSGVDRFVTGGMSSESIGVDVVLRDGEATRTSRVVVRLAPPEGTGVFQTYELGKQAKVQEILDNASIPVARPIGAEDDPTVLGASFIVMPFVTGRIPPDNPPFPTMGWVVDLDSESRHKLASSALDTLADVHALDWRALGLDFVARPGGPSLESEIAWWEGYLEWAAGGAESKDLKTLNEIMAWSKAHRPSHEPPSSLIWGDVRLGNVIFDDELNVAAVLDWEMATIGPAEHDLGWYFGYRNLLCSMLGLPGLPELQGFPEPEAELERYEQRLGRPVQDLDWYIAFAGVRIAAAQARVRQAIRQKAETGQLQPEFYKLLEAPLVQEWVYKAMEHTENS